MLWNGRSGSVDAVVAQALSGTTVTLCPGRRWCGWPVEGALLPLVLLAALGAASLLLREWLAEEDCAMAHSRMVGSLLCLRGRARCLEAAGGPRSAAFGEGSEARG